MQLLLSPNPLPDVLVPLDVDLVELAGNGRDEILFHFDGHVLGQHREKKALLEETYRAS